MASSLLSRTTSTPSSAVSSRTCQCPSAAAVAAAVIRPSRRVQRHQLQLPLQRQLLLEQQPTAHSWVVRSSASSDTTASGSSGAPEGQVSSAIIEAMQVRAARVSGCVRQPGGVRSPAWPDQLLNSLCVRSTWLSFYHSVFAEPLLLSLQSCCHHSHTLSPLTHITHHPHTTSLTRTHPTTGQDQGRAGC